MGEGREALLRAHHEREQRDRHGEQSERGQGERPVMPITAPSRPTVTPLKARMPLPAML